MNNTYQNILSNMAEKLDIGQNKKILKFSIGNTKILELAQSHGLKSNEVTSFDLPAGWTCPAADKCQSFSNRENGKITDGDNCKFRCYAASMEARYSAARKAHWHNYDILKSLSLEKMVKLILSSIPKETKVIRIHASGDFFSKRYFQAWVKVAESRTDVRFYGYTKIINYVDAPKPDNFHLNYSFGGKMDKKLKLQPTAYVVKNIAEANERGLQVACIDNPSDDFDFIMASRTFALCLHGTQPAKR
jgi:hypothetical protein